MQYKDMTPEQKRERNRSNAASVSRYNAKTYSKLTFRIRQDGADGLTADTIKAAAAAAGESVNQYIIGAIRARLEGADNG